eukprot:9493487-Heterocapsa_arctica.AAC.1
MHKQGATGVVKQSEKVPRRTRPVARRPWTTGPHRKGKAEEKLPERGGAAVDASCGRGQGERTVARVPGPGTRRRQLGRLRGPRCEVQER